jgi:chaperonin GroEL
MSVGYAKKVVITKEDTTIIGGEGDKEKLEKHVLLLKANLQEEPFEVNKIKLKERLSKLEGGAAIIHVGALSEVEMLEKKDRIDDALSATRSALEQGVVIGGGYSLLNCLPELLNLDYNNEDEKLGIDIVIKAISKPNEAILNNAGLTKPEIDYNLKNTTGLNVRTKQVEDLMTSGVIDSAKVVMSAITNSITVSSMFLTIECAIINRGDVIEKNPGMFC